MGGILIKGHLSNLQDLHMISFTNKSVLIIGLPGSGKTHIASYIHRNLCPHHHILHTDNYMRFGYDYSLYKILDDIKGDYGNLIIEGIQGYRLLRKGAKDKSYLPNIVIQIETSIDSINNVYFKERGRPKLHNLSAIAKGTDEILREYGFHIRNKPYHPDWYVLNNDFDL
jgi:predicted ATPase